MKILPTKPAVGGIPIRLNAQIANAKIVGAENMRRFKEQVSGLLVGALFILLASRFDLARARELTLTDALFVAAVILIVLIMLVAGK